MWKWSAKHASFQASTNEIWCRCQWSPPFHRGDNNFHFSTNFHPTNNQIQQSIWVGRHYQKPKGIQALSSLSTTITSLSIPTSPLPHGKPYRGGRVWRSLPLEWRGRERDKFPYPQTYPVKKWTNESEVGGEEDSLWWWLWRWGWKMVVHTEKLKILVKILVKKVSLK